MPANTKYLTSNKWQRFAKISAGILGGFVLSTSFHIALAAWVYRPEIIISSSFSGFLMWSTLMILAFLSHNGWKTWGIFLLTSLCLAAIAYTGLFFNPIIH